MADTKPQSGWIHEEDDSKIEKSKSLKIEDLQREVLKKSEDYADYTTKKDKEKVLAEQAKLIVRRAVIGAIQEVYKTDVEKYKHQVEKFQTKIFQEREWKTAQLEKEELMIYELTRARQKVLDLRKAKEEGNMEARWLTYKIDELITENAEVHTKVLAEQERHQSICDSLKDELKSAEKERLRLEECNSILEKEASDLKRQLNLGSSKITELERLVFVLNEKLAAKEQIIEEFAKEKQRARAIRRVFSCSKY